MKAVLCLLLCGVACAVPNPNCNQDYPKECMTQDPDIPVTPDALNAACGKLLKGLNCQLDFAKQCPNTLTGAFREVVEDYLHVTERVCDEKDPLRQVYLRKAVCLKENQDKLEKECRASEPAKEYCEQEYSILECLDNHLNEKCGSDGKELYDEILKAMYDTTKVFCRTE